MQLTQKKQAVVSGDGTLLMLLSLNFLLLAFFILLNGMATREQGHAKDVLAQVREGYEAPGLPVADNGTLALLPRQGWQQELRTRVQGLVRNRLDFTTIPLEVDADRLVMKFPLSTMFEGESLRQPEMVRNLVAAGGRDSWVIWEVSGPLEQGATLAIWAGRLAMETGRVVTKRGAPEVRVTFIPRTAAPEVGGTLQQLGVEAGASRVEGEGVFNDRE